MIRSPLKRIQFVIPVPAFLFLACTELYRSYSCRLFSLLSILEHCSKASLRCLYFALSRFLAMFWRNVSRVFYFYLLGTCFSMLLSTSLFPSCLMLIRISLTLSLDFYFLIPFHLISLRVFSASKQWFPSRFSTSSLSHLLWVSFPHTCGFPVLLLHPF